ncbi:MAG: hypothetical protein JNK18_07590 [Cyclobacteriaceae bacterium]|nr:hypothetical protein [Cyclobacteriaceae bacterium]
MQLQDLHNQTSAFKGTNRFPAWFIGHGSPMNVLMDNNFTLPADDGHLAPR